MSEHFARGHRLLIQTTSPWVFVAAIWLVAVLAALVWWRRSGGTIIEDQCARCRYLVRGLPGNICPECGADLTPAGSILSAGERRPRPSRLLFLIAITSIVPLAAVLTDPIVRSFPAPRSFGENIRVSPWSGRFVDLGIAHEGFGYDPVPTGALKIFFTPPSGVIAIVEINEKTMQCSYPGKDWERTHGPFNPQVMLTVMQTTGIDASSSQASVEAQEIDQAVRDIIAHKSPMFPTSNWKGIGRATWGTTYVPRWYSYAIYAGWLMLAIVIVLVIQYSQRRRSVNMQRTAGTVLGQP